MAQILIPVQYMPMAKTVGGGHTMPLPFQEMDLALYISVCNGNTYTDYIAPLQKNKVSYHRSTSYHDTFNQLS